MAELKLTSRGLGINDAGVIVGQSRTKTGKFKAFVWRRGGVRVSPDARSHERPDPSLRSG
jgi:probable HAF family extracellular repeat protein